jgi:hypothetical protein
MKALISQVLLVLACMGLVSLVGAQTASQGTGASKEMPREACRAVETYVATIDAAQAQLDAAKRTQQYDQAKAQLEPVLKRFGKESVMVDAARYATYVETIVNKDATDAQLTEAMDKRLKLRAQLLGMCDSFTATR